jgi:transcriptional regulator with XRE-family HTH domain
MKTMTQRQLAENSGLLESQVSMILAGKRTATTAQAKALEGATAIPRLRWLYPEEYGNPMIKGCEHEKN